MPKQALSVTLDEDNLLWLRGRAAQSRRRSLSEALDEIVTAARTGGLGASASRSVVGTVDVLEGDPDLAASDELMRNLFQSSMARPVVARQTRATFNTPSSRRSRARKPVRRG